MARSETIQGSLLTLEIRRQLERVAMPTVVSTHFWPGPRAW